MITGTFTTAVGNISIEIDDGGAQAYVEVSKLGNLKYEFDQTPDSVQIDRTIALYSYIQVVYEGLTDSSEDLYTRLIDSTATSAIDCTLSIDNFGVDTFEFSFELKQENIDYDEKTGEVSVRFTPRIRSNVSNETVIDGADTNYVYFAEDADGNTANLNCLPVGDYVGRAMNLLFDNQYSNYIQSAKTRSNVKIYPSDSDLSNGDDALLMVSQTGVDFTFDENNLEPQQGTGTVDVNIDRVYLGLLEYVGTFDYEHYQYTYYIRQTDILDQVSVGDRILLLGDQLNQAPIEIDFAASTQNELVSFPYDRYLIPGTIPPPLTVYDQSLYTDADFFILSSIAIDKVEKTLKELSSATGAIFGTGFSENFFVYRLSDNEQDYVTIAYDQDVVNIKQKRLNKYINEAVVRQISDQRNSGEEQFGVIPNNANLIIPNLIGSGTFARLQPSALKSLEINIAPAYPYLNKGTKASSGYLFFDSITSVNGSEVANADLEKRLTNASLQSYVQALAQENGGLKIEMECLNALTLRPYSLFQFDSTAPEKYQNKQYRISSISYDFIKNTYKVVGYQISNLTSKPITQPPGGGGSDGPPPGGNNGDGADGPPPGGNNGGDNGTDPDDVISTPSSPVYEKGWNLISNPTTTSLFPNSVFGQDYSQGTLTLFNGSYISSSQISNASQGNGYWINIQWPGAETKTFDWSGTRSNTNVYGLSVKKGWNLIGAIGQNAEIVSNTANIYSGTTYSFYTGNYIQEDYLYPGYGYFVNADADGTIDIVATQNATVANVVNYNETNKRVRIQSSKSRRDVYFDGTFSNANTPTQSVQFPPPIGTTFDVRINQDETNTALRDLRAVESNTINIDVQQIDSATTLNITPKIGDAAGSYYQATFLNGDKIITALNVAENTAYDVPITTTRITLQPMPATIKLPVRAKDIANDDGELLDTVAIEGTSGPVSDRIQYLNSTGKITRIETTEDAPEFRPVKNLQLSLASYDDYDLPDGTLFGVVGITSPYSVTFTGFLDEGGREVTFISRPNITITFNHEDSNSDANHRFVLPNSSNVTISEYQTATFVYVTLENRWYMTSKT